MVSFLKVAGVGAGRGDEMVGDCCVKCFSITPFLSDLSLSMLPFSPMKKAVAPPAAAAASALREQLEMSIASTYHSDSH